MLPELEIVVHFGAMCHELTTLFWTNLTRGGFGLTYFLPVPFCVWLQISLAIFVMDDEK